MMSLARWKCNSKSLKKNVELK